MLSAANSIFEEPEETPADGDTDGAAATDFVVTRGAPAAGATTCGTGGAATVGTGGALGAAMGAAAADGATLGATVGAWAGVSRDAGG
jgi:hypothetical protein